MSWVVTGVTVGTSILGSAMGSAAEQEQAYAQRAHDRRINERKDRAQMEAWMDQAEDHGKTAAAKAEAVVNANASGSAGASVDQSLQQNDDAAARVQDAIEKQRRDSMIGIGQEYEDLYWARDAQKKELRLTGQISNYDTGDIKSAGVNWAGAAAAGVSAWAANR